MSEIVPLNPQQGLVQPPQLAGLLGVSVTTIYRWTRDDARFHTCLFRPGYFSVQKLRDAKILPQIQAEVTHA